MVKKISTLEPTWKRTTTSNLYVVRYTGSFDAERSITCCQSFLSFGFNTFFFSFQNHLENTREHKLDYFVFSLRYRSKLSSMTAIGVIRRKETTTIIEMVDCLLRCPNKGWWEKQVTFLPLNLWQPRIYQKKKPWWIVRVTLITFVDLYDVLHSTNDLDSAQRVIIAIREIFLRTLTRWIVRHNCTDDSWTLGNNRFCAHTAAGVGTKESPSLVVSKDVTTIHNIRKRVRIHQVSCSVNDIKHSLMLCSYILKNIRLYYCGAERQPLQWGCKVPLYKMSLLLENASNSLASSTKRKSVCVLNF